MSMSATDYAVSILERAIARARAGTDRPKEFIKSCEPWCVRCMIAEARDQLDNDNGLGVDDWDFGDAATHIARDSCPRKSDEQNTAEQAAIIMEEGLAAIRASRSDGR